MICQWCESDKAESIIDSVYWELPDGKKAIEITETPTIHCPSCGMKYQMEAMVGEIEDHLFLIDTSKLAKIVTFEELMAQPRLLKRNYFNFN